MRKARNKKLSLLVTIVFLFTIMVPFAGVAGAATGLTAYSAPTVSDDGWFKLGTVIVEMPTGAIENGDVVILSLPSGFDYIDDITKDPDTTTKSVYAFTGNTNGSFKISAPQTIDGKQNSLYNDTGHEFTAQLLDDNQLRVEVTGYNVEPDSDAAMLKLEFTSVFVKEGFTGDIKLTADGPSGSGFPKGDVVIGAVAGGAATIAVMDSDTSNDDFSVKLRVSENRAGALKAEVNSIKLTLPDGFEWVGSDGALTETTIWGQDLDLNIAYDEEEAEIQLVTKSTEATSFEITLNFEVADETEAEMGDVICKVGGKSSLDPKELTVGKYGDFSVTIDVDGDVPQVFAGKTEQEIATIVIEEGLKGSLVDGRTVLLTLPSNARWIASTLGDTDSHKGVYLEYVGLTGTDDRTAKFKVNGAPSTGSAKLEIEDVEIMLEAGKVGDVVVEVSGSAGLSGELVVAEAISPVTITASSKPSLQIGKANQVVGDLVITETKEGAIAKDKNLVIDLTEGVSFAAAPTVEVIEGDIKIDKGGVFRKNSDEGTKDNQLVIPITNDSDEASTIKISNLVYTVDRTVPEGDILVAVVGTAVNETGGAAGTEWPNARAAAVTSNATVGTPAPGDAKMSAAFVLGSTTYKVNGVEQTMDVAPYAKDGRTYLPVRYVGYALGVSDANILYDSASQTVTMLKGDKVVQLTIGSKNMVVNGATIAMDVAPEAVDGRTMLPFRWIAWAFGASVNWDAATQTVTMEL